MQTFHTRAFLAVLIATVLAACNADNGGGSDDPRRDGGAASPTADAAAATSDGGASSIEGGVWMNAAACPTQAPQGEAACTQPLECRYGGDVCMCSRAAPADPMRWRCDDDDDDFGGGASCPAAEPTVGTACMETRGECTFGSRACACADATDTWACWNRADCPQAAPSERAACSTIGMECEYETQGNDDLDCECEASGWNCDRQLCPGAKPAIGGACEEGDGTCSFGEEVCDCAEDAWVCWRPSDCPTAVPAPLSACSTRGMTCPFANDVCECDEEGWDCD